MRPSIKSRSPPAGPAQGRPGRPWAPASSWTSVDSSTRFWRSVRRPCGLKPEPVGNRWPAGWPVRAGGWRSSRPGRPHPRWVASSPPTPPAPAAQRLGYPRDQTISLRAVLETGDVVDLTALPRATIPAGADRLAAIHRSTIALLERHAEVIVAERPRTPFNRCGYLLHNVLTADTLDYPRLLAGTEGTLALFTEVTLRTEPLPGGRGVALFACADLHAALQAIARVLPRRPAACELLDGRLLSLVRARGAEAAQARPRSRRRGPPGRIRGGHSGRRPPADARPDRRIGPRTPGPARGPRPDAGRGRSVVGPGRHRRCRVWRRCGAGRRPSPESRTWACRRRNCRAS